MSHEFLSLVDNSQLVDKLTAHCNPPIMHQAVSVWLFNDRGETLLQKRSLSKIVFSLVWANSVCGNVGRDEMLPNCAQRRLREELGLKKILLHFVYEFSYKAFANEKYSEFEKDSVFIGKYQGNVKLNPNEVTKVLLFNFQELKRQVKIKVDALDETSQKLFYHPLQTVAKPLQVLKEKLPLVHADISNHKLILAPWTVMMLLDKRLETAYMKLAESYV